MKKENKSLVAQVNVVVVALFFSVVCIVGPFLAVCIVEDEAVPVNAFRTDFIGDEMLFWLIQQSETRPMWALFAATSGGFEFDLGKFIQKGAWGLQFMLCVDGHVDSTGVQLNNIFPQFNALLLPEPGVSQAHAETWLINSFPIHNVGKGSHTWYAKKIGAHRVKNGPLFLGGQFDGTVGSKLDSELFLGPLVELEVTESLFVSGTVQWPLGDINEASSSRIQPTSMLVF
ncbi:hypothetical protein KKB10_04065 [Patescibacteria group bacterium]|nr:hypothetical protein [Patescibacteria group bacterium]MBU1951728.1 hypothetical protein [Patescibacteria group bacterium]